MKSYVCPKCHKDLGTILRKAGVPEDVIQAVVLFHQSLHWREEQERWRELLEAARQVVAHQGYAFSHPRLERAVEALKEIP